VALATPCSGRAGFARTSVCAAHRGAGIEVDGVNVLVVSGIWPPDVGGPASHAPEVARFLHERGHGVEVVTTAAAAPEPRSYPVHWVQRSVPRGLRHLRGLELIRSRARRADVVYTTGMFGRSAAGSLAARRPYVVKLTADPAFERSRRTGLVGGDVDQFQSGGGGPAVAVLRSARDFELGHAAHVFCPSAYLRELAISWGVHPGRVGVLPNPAPDVPELRPREELKAELGVNGATIAFAGRLTAQKSLDRALAAVAAADGVSLVVAGEGPDREPLEAKARELGIAGRVRFLGAQPRQRVVELFRAADATILSSSWENFPHTVVEALAVGTPVLAMEAGGVAEVVHDGVNGLLVPAGDTEALAGAVRRYFADEALRERLRARAAESVADYSAERVFAQLEDVLRAVA
jgi:glycosyltransferase involved in cell wall biosynthesis